MLNKLKSQLAEQAGKIARAEKIEALLETVRHHEQRLIALEGELRRALSKENADVQRLEKTTVTSVFYSILGKKETRLDEEQQQAYSAQLKYDAAQRQLEDCRAQLSSLKRERDSLQDSQRCYDQIYNEILEQLKENPDYAARLCQLEKQLGEADNQLREIAEAISAGNTCLSQVGTIENSLEGAEGWGTFDLIGGGLISDIAKHSHLDDAQVGVNTLQNMLRRFHAELADVHVSTQVSAVNVEGFLLFADYFFDGLIADWCVLDRIHNSFENMSKVKSELNSALSKLKTLQSNVAKEAIELTNQIDLLVQSS